MCEKGREGGREEKKRAIEIALGSCSHCVCEREREKRGREFKSEAREEGEKALQGEGAWFLESVLKGQRRWIGRRVWMNSSVR